MNGKFESIYKHESMGGMGSFGVEILVYGTGLTDFKSPECKKIMDAARDAIGKIDEELVAASIALNPKSEEQRIKERDHFISLFPSPIFVEEIPNGYDLSAYNRHLPWFIITTTIGRFKIGWRRRVINIEWDQTVGTKTAEELFKDEQVTKQGKTIHAWGYDKAKEYITVIIDSAKNPKISEKSS